MKILPNYWDAKRKTFTKCILTGFAGFYNFNFNRKARREKAQGSQSLLFLCFFRHFRFMDYRRLLLREI
ncbi:hypothetical protein D0809_23490 [Flavobacterium circumlabens]|uniref:Uncharacterized protein n=1 Tax=Flavobacterium circumlabens TaxID=2133765 RepID=A0A4Y7U7U0_9FLAO|nr:hypothetical protein D0809_23490 [Flavobacterium circumlabens]